MCLIFNLNRNFAFVKHIHARTHTYIYTRYTVLVRTLTGFSFIIFHIKFIEKLFISHSIFHFCVAFVATFARSREVTRSTWIIYRQANIVLMTWFEVEEKYFPFFIIIISHLMASHQPNNIESFVCASVCTEFQQTILNSLRDLLLIPIMGWVVEFSLRRKQFMIKYEIWKKTRNFFA